MKRFSLPTDLSRRGQALLTCGILFATGAIGTTALWSTSAATVSGTFTTANVKIHANGSATHTFAFPGSLLPGDTTAAVVQVQNVGSIPFNYTASVSSNNTALGRGVTLTARRGGTVSGSTCSGGTGITTATNRTITDTSLVFYTAPSLIAKQTGTDNLCFQLNLPNNAPANLAGTGGSVLFTFNATGA